MATTYDSLRLRHQRRMDQRLIADHRRMAREMALEIMRAAGPDGLIPNRLPVRESLRARMWERILRPYYIGADEPLRGPDPQSPYARLLVDGIEGATRIQAERQAALVRRAVRDREVAAWLTGPGPLTPFTLPVSDFPPTSVAGMAFDLSTGSLGTLRGADGRIDVDAARAALVRPPGTYDPFHLFVDANGYRLSDRIWRTGVEVRARVDRLMEYHIAQGTSATEVAKLLETFLTPGGRLTRTQTPYGTEGSYAARRLARTEITAASGRATVNAAAANPFVEKLQWRLSASHPRIDHCDDNARGGENGDGIYEIGNLPRYPDHPNCMCSILPVTTGSTSDLVDQLRADIQAAKGRLVEAASGGDPARARRLQGLLNPDAMTKSLMDGTLDTTIADAVRGSARPLPAPVAESQLSTAERNLFAKLKGKRTLTEAEWNETIRVLDTLPAPPDSATATPAARNAALAQIEKAQKVEAQLTRTIVDVADENGATMFNLEFRAKGAGSAARKVAGDVAESARVGVVISEARAAAEVSDYLRYTMLAPEETLVSTAKTVIDDLAKLGYEEYKFKNFFAPGNPYRGWNGQFINKETGFRFELQFHTPASSAAKEQAHLIFERTRTMTNDYQIDEWSQVSSKLWNDVGTPTGWEDLPGKVIR